MPDGAARGTKALQCADSLPGSLCPPARAGGQHPLLMEMVMEILDFPTEEV